MKNYVNMPEDFGMEYEMGGESDFGEEVHVSSGLLEDVLLARGVGNFKSYKPTELRWSELDVVVERTIDLMMEVNRVGVLYDVDVDGLVAGKIIEEDMKRRGLMVYRFMNSRKKHGITRDVMEFVKHEGIELLFVVDAGTNDIEYHRELSEMGVTVIVLDHHEQTRKEDIKDVYVVNCSVYEHLPKLSGAGVCYRFVELLDRTLRGRGVSQYEPWVGLTVLSDHCSMLDEENRYYVDRLYEKYDKIDLFKSFDFYGSRRNLFLFGVIPFLNACIRTNNGHWAMEVVQMSGVSNIKRFVKQKREFVLQLQKEIMARMVERGKFIEGERVVIVRLDDADIEWSGLTGLLANRIMSDRHRSVIVSYKEEGYLRGSFRGQGAVNKGVLESIGWTIRGHEQAAGVELLLDGNTWGVIEKTRDLVVGKAKVRFDVEIKDVDIVRRWEDLKQVARFNEMTGGELETIKVRIVRTRNLDKEPFKAVWGKKVEYDFQSFRVRDFQLDRVDEEWIVEPLLDREGIVLLRQ